LLEDLLRAAAILGLRTLQVSGTHVTCWDLRVASRKIEPLVQYRIRKTSAEFVTTVLMMRLAIASYSAMAVCGRRTNVSRGWEKWSRACAATPSTKSDRRMKQENAGCFSMVQTPYSQCSFSARGYSTPPLGGFQMIAKLPVGRWVGTTHGVGSRHPSKC
jgi:hypothetical protein